MKTMTKSYWYNSIKFRLMAMMIIISIVPIGLLGCYNIRIIKSEMGESINKQHVLTASRVSHAVSDLVRTLQISLETISLTNSEILSGNDKGKQENLLYGILKNFPYLEQISIVSETGEETLRVSKRYTVSADDLMGSCNKACLEELKQGRSFIGSPEIDMDNQIIFDLGVPVGGINKDFKSGIIAKISLRQIMQEISSVEIADGSYIMLVGEKGQLIGHSDYSQVLRRQDVSGSKGVQDLLKNKDPRISPNKAPEFKPIVYRSYTGEEVLGVYGLIPTVGWGVVVEQPLVNTYSNLNTVLFRLSLTLFLVIITIIGLGAIFISYFIKPINELARGVASVKKDDLAYQIPKQSNNELGLVIEAFNEMIREIKLKRDSEKIAIQAEKRAAIGLLAAGVAHEVNNPMNNLGFYADDLLERLEVEDINTLKEKGVLKEYLLSIREQIYRCTDITQSLLNFSREVEPQIRQVNVSNVILEVLKLVKYPISKHNIEVDLQWEEPIPYIFADESQLQQVILNLVTNSIDAMPNGGKLTIRIIDEDRNKIGIEVIDTGEGILEEAMKHVFDPFYTTKPVGKGTGLGLSTSQVIVERMGGTITLENNEETGVKAKLYLPIASEVMKNATV